ALLRVAPPPALEIGVHLGRPILHRVGIDRRLEPVGQQPLHLATSVPGLDLRRDVLPEHHLVLRHQAAASTSSARRVSSAPSPVWRTSSGMPRYSAISRALSRRRSSANCSR